MLLWIGPISLPAFSVPSVICASLSTSVPRTTSAATPAMANNRAKAQSEPSCSSDLHTGDRACQIQRSAAACSVSVCLSSMAHAILFAEVSLPAS